MMQANTFFRGLLLVSVAATTLGAQRGARPGGAPLPDPAAPPGAKPADTSIVRKTPDGFVLDFQEQELRVVLSAIAEAGGLNVALNNIPSKRITLRMGQTISRAGALDVLKGIAESNSLRVTEGPSLIRIDGTPPVTQLQQAQQFQAAAQLRLYTYRLKHASATQLAPVLMNLLVGSGAGQNVFGNQNGANGPFQIFTPAAPNVPGRAGGAGTNIVPNGNINIGGPGRGGAATNNQIAQGQAVGAALAAQMIQQLSGGGALSNASAIRIVAEESTNSLLVRATTEDWGLVQQVLASVDLRPLQVLIEVSIAQVSRTHDLSLGISGSQTKRVSNTQVDTQAIVPSAASARDFIFALTGGKGAVSYNVAFNALQTRGDVKVLSLPLVIAQNNKEAILNVGQSVPFVQTSQTVPNDPTNRVNTVQYQEVGTTLTITPTINPDGYVNLAVKQTNNSATNNVQFNAPIIDKREATTQIFIRDGQTTVIGGLSDNTSNNTTSGVPFLSRIPWLGGLLFGNTQKSAAVSELYLFLTPHIVSSDEDIDRLREAVKTGSDLLQETDIKAHVVPVVDTLKLRPRPDSTRRRPEDR
ncbi:MAG: secretin N-terminal domain-containing protein [bacterium]